MNCDFFSTQPDIDHPARDGGDDLETKSWLLTTTTLLEEVVRPLVVAVLFSVCGLLCFMQTPLTM